MGDEQHSGCMKTGSLERNMVTVWGNTHWLTHQEIHPYCKFTVISSWYCPLKKNCFYLYQSVSVHLQHDGVKMVKFKDTEYWLETASTQNCLDQPKYAFWNWSVWPCIIQTHTLLWLVGRLKLLVLRMTCWTNTELETCWSLSFIVFTRCLSICSFGLSGLF